jgi:pyruvate,orthophosphate dikinase
MMQHVYYFGDGSAEGHSGIKNSLGGKGTGLAEMCRLGLPVPPGFTISTEACVHYFNQGGHPVGLKEAVEGALTRLEQSQGKRFGQAPYPLLVSVRSGARVSMPGMMDTVLNLGLNSDAVAALAQASGDERFAWDSYRRFIQMYGNVVMGMDHGHFEHALSQLKEDRGVKVDTGLSGQDMRGLVDTYLGLVRQHTDRPFPTNAMDQLWGAINAVFDSWNTDRAKAYRRIENIPDDWGTAVNVQAMVYGNMGNDCATGVAFTRDPSTGEKTFYGEYLTNAQGEDVVAGIRTPLKLNGDAPDCLEKVMPEAYAELHELQAKLELHYKDMQDIEFTVERGNLFLLQTRNGKRTGAAALKVAVDLVKEGVIDQRTAVSRVSPEHISYVLLPQLDPSAPKNVIAKGLNASPGGACGKLVFSAEKAVEWAALGEAVILMRPETSPEDIAGMAVARAIVTARGGATSHAAVVARGMGKPCVAGCGALGIDLAEGRVHIGDLILNEGDIIAIDGAKGHVILGEVSTIDAELSEDFHTVMGWADKIRKLRVRANADTPEDSRVAREFGAEGIGLCRTEHMFFEKDRILAVRQMIVANNKSERRVALAKLLPMQRSDFIGIFRAMKGLPVTIRLLDPPLHEFLPQHGDDLTPLANELGIDVGDLSRRVESLRESNPMLGHRGCRLAITYPEICEMQVEAIVSAACTLVRDEGFTIVPEIMIPLVGLAGELSILREVSVKTADRIIAEFGVNLDYLIGTMIELPRACLTADEVAVHADFFSFGTNDLTQTTYGLSRDDSGKFLPYYIESGLMSDDPFATIDKGVAELVSMAVKRGRSVKSDLKIGICGEHGGDPRSVEFCHHAGLDYVSCSPYRVPVARMAAAHAVLNEGK